jgi:hypothetical protein
MQEHAAVITDLLGASASLAGLALVFLGMIATATASDEPGEKRSVAARARRPVYAVLLAFVFGVLCVATAAIWLVALRSVIALYMITIVLFFVQLALLLSATSWSVRQVLLRK